MRQRKKGKAASDNTRKTGTFQEQHDSTLHSPPQSREPRTLTLVLVHRIFPIVHVHRRIGELDARVLFLISDTLHLYVDVDVGFACPAFVDFAVGVASDDGRGGSLDLDAGRGVVGVACCGVQVAALCSLLRVNKKQQISRQIMRRGGERRTYAGLVTNTRLDVARVLTLLKDVPEFGAGGEGDHARDHVSEEKSMPFSTVYFYGHG